MGEDNILATVLAGGKSQRFGKNKSEVLLNKKKLMIYMLKNCQAGGSFGYHE